MIKNKNKPHILTIAIISVLIIGMFINYLQIKDINNTLKDTRELQSELVGNSNALNCYTFNNEEMEAEYYNCMYNY